MTSAEWLSTADVRAVSGKHPVTIRLAAEAGELHGHQRMRGGRWAFTRAAVDAWIKGLDSRTACGCTLVAVRRAS